jgi:hypothetical protein
VGRSGKVLISFVEDVEGPMSEGQRRYSPKYNERRGDHVWTEGDRESPAIALRLDYWAYEPIPKIARSTVGGG